MSLVAFSSCSRLVAGASRTASPAIAPRSLRNRVVVRSSTEPPVDTPATTSESTSAAAPTPVPVAVAASTAYSLTDAMAFTNASGPELINGRLAMVGVLAALGAELATGESVFQQFQGATPVVLATWALFSVASLVPLVKGSSQEESWGPFTPKAERINGWVAMVGVASLLLVELIRGQALF